MPEIALLWCLWLNILVFGSAYCFARRRITNELAQACLDAALFGFAIQYIAVALPGILGILRPSSIAVIAITLSVALWRASPKTQGPKPEPPTPTRWIIRATTLFTAAYILAFAWNQRLLPVMSNDALTYHFPAAVHWLQTGRLGLFQVWFFNPANTFSPLTGSTFIAWLLAPLGNDILARFVELPALLFVGLGIYQIFRQLRLEPAAAALLASAAILSRPLFFQSIMGKDDLFLTAFFICALLALMPAHRNDPLGPIRLGIALGLLLATKYTAWFSAPILLLAIHSNWKPRQWAIAIAVAALLAGPWYLRNAWLTGNPIFPISFFPLFHGLFTTAPSEHLRHIPDIWSVLTGGSYGLPVILFTLTACGWIVMCLRHARSLQTDALLRTCLLGPILGLILFIYKSPFAEVRFIFPTFILLFANLATAIELLRCSIAIKRLIASSVLALSIWTQFIPSLRASELNFLFPALIAMLSGTAFLWFAPNLKPLFRLTLYMVATLVSLGFLYVYWNGYVAGYQSSRFDTDSGWAQKYPYETALWKYIDQNIPADAVLAYTNTYLIYPMESFSMQRRLVYAPTLVSVQSQADLPWIGNQIPGEQLVAAITLATTTNPQRGVWLANLQKSGVNYLYIAKSESLASPPESAFAAQDPQRFIKLIENDAGTIYRIDWTNRK